MKYTSYLALVDRVLACPQIAQDRQAFAQEMAAVRAQDESGYAALFAAAGALELQEAERPQPGKNLSEEQRTENLRTAWRLYARLTDEGVGTYAALWASGCWFNALAWPLCLTDEGYLEWVQALPDGKLEALASQEDGYAAAALAERYALSGDAQSAAHWYKTAFDCCDVLTMRWMEDTVQESGMTQKGYEILTSRHASLGDPEGIAAYALYLLEQDPEQNREKALSLAVQSAEMQSEAGEDALQRCLNGMKAVQTAQPEENMDTLESAESEPEMTETPPSEEPSDIGTDPADQTGAEEEPDAAIEPQRRAQADGGLEALWPCISGVLGRVDQEMIDATGDPAPDAALVDVLLACLCGAMAAYDSDEQKKAVSGSLIASFDALMPGFAENGFDEAYLHEEYAAVAGAMNGYRAGYADLLAQQGVMDDMPWERMSEIECAAACEIIDQVIQLDAPAQERIREAVFGMLLDLKTALGAAQ